MTLPTDENQTAANTNPDVPEWLRERRGETQGGAGNSIPANAEDVFTDYRRRMKDPSKPRQRVLARVKVRDGSGYVLLAGGHLVRGNGEWSEPLPFFFEELEAVRKHSLASPAQAAGDAAALAAFELEIARDVKRMATEQLDRAWDQANAKEVSEFIASGKGSPAFLALVKRAREHTNASPEGEYFAANDEGPRPVLAIEILDAQMAAPEYAIESQQSAQAELIAQAVGRAVAIATSTRATEAAAPAQKASKP